MQSIPQLKKKSTFIFKLFLVVELFFVLSKELSHEFQE